MTDRHWLHARKRPLYERLWAKVQVRESGCWEWTGARQRGRWYGIIHTERGSALTHRLVYQMTTGPIPDGICVCHRCDNPICVNPAHLFLGTIADNNADRHAKGRTRGARGEASPYRMAPEKYHRGEATPTSKLTEAQVREIRRRVAGGEPQRGIAREFGLGASQVCRIIRGRSWRHVPT